MNRISPKVMRPSNFPFVPSAVLLSTLACFVHGTALDDAVDQRNWSSYSPACTISEDTHGSGTDSIGAAGACVGDSRGDHFPFCGWGMPAGLPHPCCMELGQAFGQQPGYIHCSGLLVARIIPLGKATLC